MVETTGGGPHGTDYFHSRASLTDWAIKLHGKVAVDEHGEACIRCPGPGHTLNDDSLLVRFDDEASGGFRVQTFCPADDDQAMLKDFVRQMVGMPSWRPGEGKPNGKSNGKHHHAEIIQKWLYTTALGEPLLLVSKTKPKGFLQQRPTAGGGWEWGGIKELDKLPYRWPEVLEAMGKDQEIKIVEGEKDADNLWTRGVAATTSPGGACKWPKHFGRLFTGARLLIIPDNDVPGIKHARQVFENVVEHALSAEIRYLEGVIEGGDVTDWLASGGDPFKLHELRDKPPGRGYHAAELWAMKFPAIAFAVPDLIAEGLTLLAGAPKRGKSWLALDVCCAVASGGYTLGDRHCTEGDVLLCALEDSPRRMQSRLHTVRQLSETPPPRLTVWFAKDLPRLGNGCVEALEEWLDDHPKPRLIVIDTLNYIRPERMRDEDPYSYDYRSATELQRLCTARGIAIVLIHHTRKSAADDYLESISGTNGLTGGCDAVIVLERQGDGSTILKGRGRDIEEFELAVRFDRESCRWMMLGDVEETRETETRGKILKCLREAAWPLTAGDIAAQTRVRKGTVDVNLHRMVKAGQVLRTKGKYSLPNVSGDADHTVVSFGKPKPRDDDEGGDDDASD
jgi:hypothetical protein